MILKGKYIIIIRHGIELPILFDDILPHSTFRHLDPIRSGFFEMETSHTGQMNSGQVIEVTTFGESSSLKLKSEVEDQEVIVQNLYKS